MALITLHRSPSGSGHSTPTKDEESHRRSRFQRRHSFVMVKGAALLLQEEEEDPVVELCGTPPLLKTHKRNKSAQDQDQQQRGHLQAMVDLLRPEDSIKLAVQLESVKLHRIRYLLVVSKIGCAGEDETILLGVDFPNEGSNRCTIGMVLPVWSSTQVFLDGDGGFSVTSNGVTRIFKPISVQTMWSMMQVLHKSCESAFHHNHFPAGSALGWVQHYQASIASEQSCINEWMAMSDLLSVRPDSPSNFTEQPSEREIAEVTVRAKLREVMMTTDLETITSKEIRNELERRMNCNLKDYKEFIDNEMLLILAQMDRPSRIFDYLYLGSEWNASNLEELQKNGVSHILNVTREIDNFFPESFKYLNVRVYDEEATELLQHWKETYRFISSARKQNSRVLVHCKMGVSRSGSTVIAYAMKEYGWSLDEALRHVKEKRPIVSPNPGFMRQLLIYQGILDASKQRHSDLWQRKSKKDQSNRLDQTKPQPLQSNGAVPDDPPRGNDKPSPIEEEEDSVAGEEEEEEEEEEEQPLKSPPYCFRPLEGLEAELNVLAIASPECLAEEPPRVSLKETSQPTICIHAAEEEGEEAGNASDDSLADEVMDLLVGSQTGSEPPEPPSLAEPESPLTPRRQRINLWSVMKSISAMESLDLETPPLSPAENAGSSKSELEAEIDLLADKVPPEVPPPFTDALPPSSSEKSEGVPQAVASKPRGKKRLPKQPRALIDKEAGTHPHRPHLGAKALARHRHVDKKIPKRVSFQPPVGKVRKQAKVLDRFCQNPQGFEAGDWQNLGGAGEASEDFMPSAHPRLKHLQSVAELKKAGLVSRQAKAFESPHRLRRAEAKDGPGEAANARVEWDSPAASQGLKEAPDTCLPEKGLAITEPAFSSSDSKEKGSVIPASSEPAFRTSDSGEKGLAMAESAVCISDSREMGSTDPISAESALRTSDSGEKSHATLRLERSMSGPKKMVRWDTVEGEEPPADSGSKDHEVSQENGAS